MGYDHTQKSPFSWILPVTGIVIVFLTWSFSPHISGVLVAVFVALALVLASLFFGSLSVRDEGEFLAVRFGPLPLFKTRMAYSEMRDVRADRSTILDGWGIHHIPWRGTIYNVWGFDCVRIQKEKKIIRVGTDDPEMLLGFLKTKVGF